MSEGTAVYRTSTFGASVPETTVVAPPAETTPPVQSTTVVNDAGQLQTPATQEPVTTTPSAATTTPETQTPTQESNVATITIPDFSAPNTTTPAQVPPATQAAATSWKDAIKSVDTTEVFKELGVSDFALELDRHMKAGGDPIDYLNARGVDYNKFTSEALVKQDLRKQYPTFTPQQIDLFFNRKYGAPEDATDEERQFAELQLEADGHTIRQREIAKQQQFKIPAAVQPTQVAAGPTPEQIAAQQQAVQQELDWFNNHDATKNLMSSKRVALDLGDGVAFNVDVDRPESLMKVITDGEIWRRVTSTPQGEPDVAALQEIALFALDRGRFKKDIFNYGKSFGIKTLVEDGQNAQRPTRTVPETTIANERDAWKNAKSGTLGGGR